MAIAIRRSFAPADNGLDNLEYRDGPDRGRWEIAMEIVWTDDAIVIVDRVQVPGSTRTET